MMFHYQHVAGAEHEPHVDFQHSSQQKKHAFWHPLMDKVATADYLLLQNFHCYSCWQHDMLMWVLQNLVQLWMLQGLCVQLRC